MRLCVCSITKKKLHGLSEEPTYSGVVSFMRRKYTKNLTGADVAISGIPLDLMVSNRPGTRFGPEAIRKASKMLETIHPYSWDFDPFNRLAVIDYGDCYFDAEKFGPLSLIHFDAHSDTWDYGDENVNDHGNMFRRACMEGLVTPKKSVQVGIRTKNPETYGYNILNAGIPLSYILGTGSVQ